MNRSFITCNRTYDPPLAFLPTGNINVIDIWPSGELRVYAQVACKDCYNQSGGSTSYYEPEIHSAKLPISYTRNKFMAIGCDTYAMIQGSKEKNTQIGNQNCSEAMKDKGSYACKNNSVMALTMVQGTGAVVPMDSKATLTIKMAAKVTIHFYIKYIILLVIVF